ncbi:MAG TPA: prolipoprotein diacylglyceryl transferase family protein [Tepidisphaeraceae bacterium]
MTIGVVAFPVYFHIFGWQIPAHPAMELIAYTGGFQFYLLLRRRWAGQRLPFEQNLWLIVGAIFGAAAGSKLLAWWESFPEYWAHLSEEQILLGGKTIVGGLLGGWAGVEIAKKKLGIRQATGDLYVFPLIFGMSVGRIGCFLTGLPDHTYGVATALPWGVDFGDGIARHPTQLYDIAFLMVLGVVLLVRMRRPYRKGEIFRLFMLAYCAWRFAVEFIKPTYKPYLHLSAIQLACVGGAAVCIALAASETRSDIADLRSSCRSCAAEVTTMSEKPDIPPQAIAVPDVNPPWVTESWAGEIRVNLIRLVAIVLFYGRHLAEYFIARGDAVARGYHLRVTMIVGVWAIAAVILHRLLRARSMMPALSYIAAILDLLLITLLCMIGDGPKSPLILLYFPFIATASLRLSLRLTYVATGGAILGYLLLLGYYAGYQIGFSTYYATPDLRIPRSTEGVMVLALLVSGLLAGQMVRQARRLAAAHQPEARKKLPEKA